MVLETIEPELVAYKKHDRTLRLKRRTSSHFTCAYTCVHTQTGKYLRFQAVPRTLAQVCSDERTWRDSKREREKARRERGKFEEEGPLDDSTTPAEALHSNYLQTSTCVSFYGSLLFFERKGRKNEFLRSNVRRGMGFSLFLNEIDSMAAISELLSFLAHRKRKVRNELISFPVAKIIESKCRKVKLAIS